MISDIEGKGIAGERGKSTLERVLSIREGKAFVNPTNVLFFYQFGFGLASGSQRVAEAGVADNPHCLLGHIEIKRLHYGPEQLERFRVQTEGGHGSRLDLG